MTGSARSLIWVPKVSSFYGITIFLYRNEGHHARPHVHARYSGEPASVDFDGELIAGSLPRRALALVADWAHLQELEENWEHARRGRPWSRSSAAVGLGRGAARRHRCGGGRR